MTELCTSEEEYMKINQLKIANAEEVVAEIMKRELSDSQPIVLPKPLLDINK